MKKSHIERARSFTQELKHHPLRVSPEIEFRAFWEIGKASSRAAEEALAREVELLVREVDLTNSR